MSRRGTLLWWLVMLSFTAFGIQLALRWISATDSVVCVLGLGLLSAIFVGWVPYLLQVFREWRLRHLVLVVVVLAMASGCGKMVPPGYVGIKVNSYGSNKGVADYPIATGMQWYNPVTTQILEFPTFVQTAVWTRSPNEGSPANEEISFNSIEGMVISGDISLSYQLDAPAVPKFYVKFRSDDLRSFTHGFLHNVARDAFNEVATRYKAEEIYGEHKEALLVEVRSRINAQVQPFGVELQQMGFIGAPRLPPQVVDALNAKLTANQRAQQVQNELATAQAEAAKTVATADGAARAKVAIAKGDADANAILSASITPTLLDWMRVQALTNAVARWDGKRPMVEGEGSGLLLSLPAAR